MHVRSNFVDITSKSLVFHLRATSCECEFECTFMNLNENLDLNCNPIG